MKREEQIRSAAFDASTNNDDYKKYPKDAIARMFFVEGAKWADNNPKSPWISVEDKLPETTDEFGRSEDVLILDENEWRTVAMYCIPENKWYLSVGAIQGDCEYPFEITHWMPIPELPKEG